MSEGASVPFEATDNSSLGDFSHRDNSSLGDFTYPDLTQVSGVRVTLVVLYLVVMVLAIGGNSLVCVIVSRNHHMHTVVHYYIVNLGVCDLLVGIFVLPVKLLELTAPAHWGILNDGLCTVFMYLETVVVFSSVLTLVAVCIERYLAIVYPLQSRVYHTKRRAKVIVVGTWLIPCLVAAPFLKPAEAGYSCLISDYGTIHRLTCFDTFSEEFRRGYYLFLFFFIYLLPLVFITITCFQLARALLKGIAFHRQESTRRSENNKRRVAKMMIVVVIAFVIFWTPYFVVTLITQLPKTNFLQDRHYFFTMLCLNLFAFLNSCVNPFIYAAMSLRFRAGFCSIARQVFCRQPSLVTTSSAANRSNGVCQPRCHRINAGRQSYSDGSRSDSGSAQFTVLRMDSLRAFTGFSRRTLVSAWRNGSSRFGSFSFSRSRSSKKQGQQQQEQQRRTGSMPNGLCVNGKSQPNRLETGESNCCHRTELLQKAFPRVLPEPELSVHGQNDQSKVARGKEKNRSGLNTLSIPIPASVSFPNLSDSCANVDERMRRCSSETVITLLEETIL